MLVLPETLTLREARDVVQMFEQAVPRDGADLLTVDASGLKSFDSAAVAVLLECARQAKSWGKRFAVRNAPAKLAELAGLYGVGELLEIRGR
jgi:phospholipid transport system transporter-binding protein